MIAYILRRIAQAVLVMLVVALVSFSLFRFVGDPVATMIHTPQGAMHFQEWWVGRNGAPTVDDVEFRGGDDASATDASPTGSGGRSRAT